MIFREGPRIGYIALDNKDRLEDPGEIIVEFDMERHEPSIWYIVRMLIYKVEPKNYLAITCHKVGDTIDCGKITYDRTDLVIHGKALENFLRANLLIWLKPNERRIEAIGLA